MSKNYTIEEKLGQGSYGAVYLAKDIRNNRKVALKIISLDKSSKKDVLQEARTSLELSKDNPYVPKYYDLFEEENNIYIVTEYVQGTDLWTFINEKEEREPSCLWPIMLQLILGLAYIHELGYAHRDIKAENVMISDDKIKYIDFGFTCIQKCKIKECENECTEKTIGTLFYAPPEALLRKRETTFEEEKAYDVWSLTMLLYELVYGIDNFPFAVKDDDGNDLEQIEIIKNIKALDKPQMIDYDYPMDDGRTRLFLKSLVEPNWRRRLTIQQILNKFIDEISSVPLVI